MLRSLVGSEMCIRDRCIYIQSFFAYMRTAALHYTSGARICVRNQSESWRLLPVSCQNLGDSCPNLAHKMQSRWPNTMSRNCKKIIQKWLPNHQNSSKLPKMLPDQQSNAPQGIKNHPKSKKRGVENRCFFDPLLEPTLPHFRLPQAPQKQPK